MSDALTEREDAIRDYLNGMGKDPARARRYATVAARWEQLRLLQARGKTTPGDDTRLRDLAAMVRALGEQLGFSELVDSRGFLPGDPARIICRDWRENAELWFLLGPLRKYQK